ncbi:hypothetical protein GCM10011609_85260 [Lentzea pudingi]|uniref:Transcriptional regulator n=1 Tax=Lentzea pudingi TaxID=1789439 RepID=A0ABQ2IVE4_9PSEU|nr:hypothetical protein [Lentzea pudingi]GGN28790.1 hypothetical protein GCM10011609_85260 [Lentzea pudingi]
MKTDTRLMTSDYVVLGVVLSQPLDRRWRVRQMAEAAQCLKSVARNGLNRLHRVGAVHKEIGSLKSRDPETYERNSYWVDLDAVPAARSALKQAESQDLRAKLSELGLDLDILVTDIATKVG